MRLLSEVLGDFRGESVDKTFKELFKTVAELEGLNIRIEKDRIFAGTFKLSNIHDFYTSIKELLPSSSSLKEPIYLISSAPVEDIRELHLFKVMIFFDGKQIYSETVGVGVKGNSIELIRGRKLLDILSKALLPEYLLSSVQEYHVVGELLQDYKIRASRMVLNKVVPAAVKEFIEYTSKLERLGFSNQHRDWHPRGLREYRDKAEYIGAIIFTTSAKASAGQPIPPIKVKEVEEAAMRIAMEYERSSGRIPQDVSMREHFDILSRNPKTGEVRYIEVKGRSGLDLEVELTETEFRIAVEKGKQYWLYIVYGIGTGKPRLLAIQDPVNSMKWKEVSVKRYRFEPR